MKMTDEDTLILSEELPPDTWRTDSFRAMGSEMALWLEAADVETTTSAFKRVEALFAANEQALSRFRRDSELSRLNACSDQWVVVSDLLWGVLNEALALAAATNGHFDPTLLNALEQYGYTTSFERLRLRQHDGPFPTVPAYPGRWTAVERDEARQAVRLPAGLRLDFGGIAKGYTAQQAIRLLQPYGPCLVDAGGDLAAGAAPERYPGWPVAISAPWTDEGEAPFDLCNMWLANEAMATSGIDFRTWQQGGRQVHHLIDPATGAPVATDCLTVTVLAETAVRAEAWATATLVAGADAGMSALREENLAGLTVTQFGNVLVSPTMQQRLRLLPANQASSDWGNSWASH